MTFSAPSWLLSSVAKRDTALMLSAALAIAKEYFTSLSISVCVSAVANGHAGLRRDVPALQQTADAVSFMQAGDNQIDEAEAAGDRLHDAVQRDVQFVDKLRDFAIRQVKGKLKQRVVDVMLAANALQAMVVL